MSSCHTSGSGLCCKIHSIYPSPELAWGIQTACKSVLLALLLGWVVCPHWLDPTIPDHHCHPVHSSSEHFCKHHRLGLPLAPCGAEFLLQIIVFHSLHTSLEWASPLHQILEVSELIKQNKMSLTHWPVVSSHQTATDGYHCCLPEASVGSLIAGHSHYLSELRRELDESDSVASTPA